MIASSAYNKIGTIESPKVGVPSSLLLASLKLLVNMAIIRLNNAVDKMSPILLPLQIKLGLKYRSHI